MELKTAKSYMKPELRNILKQCFDENDRAIDAFFEKQFNEDMTAVCTVNEKVVSSVFILENSIMYNNKEIPSCYLYAVATLPEFQGRGYMKKLMGFAESIALKSGKFYSTLYPASSELSGFYEKLGYQQFFRTGIIEFDGIKMRELLDKEINNTRNLQTELSFSGTDKNLREIDFSYLEKIRKNVYNKSGEVCWDKSILEYASEVNKIYGGKTFVNKNNYAICRKIGSIVEIVDSILTTGNLLMLIKKIDDEYNASKYIFRLQPGRELFGIKSKEFKFGMIKPLTCNENFNRILYEAQNPYLGLVMD